MGGCADCGVPGAKSGCDERKSISRERIDALIARLYPDRTWGRLDDEARFGAGVPRAEVRRLGRALAELTRAPTFFRPGADDDLCDFVWILCLGRRPSLLELRDGGQAAPALAQLGDAGGKVEERYLRLCFSSLGRVAAIQEVELSLEAQGGAALIREAPRAGVFDGTLLARMRKAVALLEASEIAHLDFGLLDLPLEGAAPGDYEQRFGTAPRVANFLFYAPPPTTHSVATLI
jgi:hypothetical protein